MLPNEKGGCLPLHRGEGAVLGKVSRRDADAVSREALVPGCGTRLRM